MSVRVLLSNGKSEEFHGKIHCRVMEAGVLSVSSILKPAFPLPIIHNVLAVYAPGVWSKVEELP